MDTAPGYGLVVSLQSPNDSLDRLFTSVLIVLCVWDGNMCKELLVVADLFIEAIPLISRVELTGVDEYFCFIGD